MASSWLVQTPASAHTLDLESVSMLIDAARGDAPGRTMLQVVNRNIPVEHMCLVAYDRDGPRFVEGHAVHSSASHRPRACFERYLRRFYRFDEAIGIAARLQQEADNTTPLLALHRVADEIPDRHWREDIYEREGLADRLSLLYASTPGSVHAIHLYRNASTGSFNPQEIDRVLAMAPLLRQVHRCTLGTGDRTGDRATHIADAERHLSHRTPKLSARERQVCARIAHGMTADGIAVDLGVTPATVITLRKRAYLKLDIHNRMDLARMVN